MLKTLAFSGQNQQIKLKIGVRKKSNIFDLFR